MCYLSNFHGAVQGKETKGEKEISTAVTPVIGD
jgi:hypothetical protein